MCEQVQRWETQGRHRDPVHIGVQTPVLLLSAILSFLPPAGKKAAPAPGMASGPIQDEWARAEELMCAHQPAPSFVSGTQGPRGLTSTLHLPLSRPRSCGHSELQGCLGRGECPKLSQGSDSEAEGEWAWGPPAVSTARIRSQCCPSPPLPRRLLSLLLLPAPPHPPTYFSSGRSQVITSIQTCPSCWVLIFRQQIPAFPDPNTGKPKWPGHTSFHEGISVIT